MNNPTEKTPCARCTNPAEGVWKLPYYHSDQFDPKDPHISACYVPLCLACQHALTNLTLNWLKPTGV